MRRQNNGQDGYFGVQLHAHHSIQDRCSDKIMTVHAAVYGQPGGYNDVVSATSRHLLRAQRNRLAAGHLVAFNNDRVQSSLPPPAEAGVSLRHDVGAPESLNEPDACVRVSGARKCVIGFSTNDADKPAEPLSVDVRKPSSPTGAVVDELFHGNSDARCYSVWCNTASHGTDYLSARTRAHGIAREARIHGRAPVPSGLSPSATESHRVR